MARRGRISGSDGDAGRDAERHTARGDRDGLFDDPVAIAALDARAFEDVAAGRLIGHAAVLYWLRSWGGTVVFPNLPWGG